LAQGETEGIIALPRRLRGEDNRKEGLHVKVLLNGDIDSAPCREEEGFNAS
jgi:hypothetical protein